MVSCDNFVIITENNTGYNPDCHRTSHVKLIPPRDSVNRAVGMHSYGVDVLALFYYSTGGLRDSVVEYLSKADSQCVG